MEGILFVAPWTARLTPRGALLLLDHDCIVREEIVIAKAGEPVARLLPFEPRCEPRQPGLLKGKIWLADDLDDPLPEEIMAAFQGERQ